MNPPRVLLIDDDVCLCESLRANLNALPSRCIYTQSGDEAVNLLIDQQSSSDPFRLVIVDLWVPRHQGQPVDTDLGLLFLLENRFYRFIKMDTPIIVFTAHESYEGCVRCMKAGAFDYLPKVCEERNNMEVLIDRCRELLYPTRRKEQFSVWIKQHIDELKLRWDGKVCAAIEADMANKAGVNGERVGGYVIMVGNSEADIGRVLIANEVLRWEEPKIISLR